MIGTRLEALKNRFTALGPLRWLLLAATAVLLLFLFSSARNAAGDFLTHVRESMQDRAIEKKETESRAHEENADTIRMERLRIEGELKAIAEQAAVATEESERARLTLAESKRRYEKSKVVGRRVDVDLDTRERDVLTADRELYPDADR
jgi:hypothetical protein